MTMEGMRYTPDDCDHPEAVVAYILRADGQWELLGIVHCPQCGQRDEFPPQRAGEKVKVVTRKDQVEGAMGRRKGDGE